MALISSTALVLTIVSSISISLHVQHRARQRDLRHQIQQMGREFDNKYQSQHGDIFKKVLAQGGWEIEHPGNQLSERSMTVAILQGDPLFSAEHYAWAIANIQLRPGKFANVNEDMITKWVTAAQVLEQLCPFANDGQPQYSDQKVTLGLTEEEVETLSDMSTFVLDRQYVLGEYGTSPLRYGQLAGYMGLIGSVGIVVPIGILLTSSLTGSHTIASPVWVVLVLVVNAIFWSTLFKNLYHQFLD